MLMVADNSAKRKLLIHVEKDAAFLLVGFFAWYLERVRSKFEWLLLLRNFLIEFDHVFV